MSRRLPSDLSYLILSYLPLTKIEECAPALTDHNLVALAKFKYKFDDPNPIYSNLDHYPKMFPARLLNYSRIAIYHGDLGHYSYLVVNVQISCILAIQQCNFDLLRCYLYMLDLPNQSDFVNLLANLAFSYLPDTKYTNIFRYLYCFCILLENTFADGNNLEYVLTQIHDNDFLPAKNYFGIFTNDPLLRILLQFDLKLIKRYLEDQFTMVQEVKYPYC